MSRRADRSVTLCGGAGGRVCRHCGRTVGRWRCKRRTCPGYARTWAFDWRVVLLENLIAYGGRAVMYVVTPPGADRLPWDRSKCRHASDVPCSGRLGCVVEEQSRRRWNESFQRRLSRIFETAQQATYRETGQRAFVLAIGKEAQGRGPAHAHFIVGVEAAADRRAARAFRRHLERLTAEPRYEFGHIHGKFVRPKRARDRGVAVVFGVGMWSYNERLSPSRRAALDESLLGFLSRTSRLNFRVLIGLWGAILGVLLWLAFR
jgi:hypothetical protein